ncbi:hypothetical protein HN51_032350 [Arachis hypogaea]|uniref:Uncharacterized protein LOC107470587 n=1 Tax=Arachis duranensis TaxID=130453 RepID=A0A6P4BP34_ARADU|nr:uncharacterized protein LOC107470587 [Arachis duranensis]XP_025623633.1 uncharacterized protein LOC112716009 [Arachis hypogaea]
MATGARCRGGSAVVSETLQLQGKIVISPSIKYYYKRSSCEPLRVRASTADSSSDFAKRMERAWLISQQPKPIACSSCNSKGHIECKWCSGTGFFIIGDNMLCEVPSKNTSCIICSAKGSMCCSDCQGTGFRARWLEHPPSSQ